MTRITDQPPQHAPSGERRTFQFFCDRCERLLASAVVESSTLLVVGESVLHGLLLCEDCRNGWVERETKDLRAELAQVHEEAERVKANHVTIVEEIQRRHDAVVPLLAQRDQYLEQRNQARQEVARLNREIATFDRTGVPVPHDHVRIEGCYRCVWPDDRTTALDAAPLRENRD